MATFNELRCLGKITMTCGQDAHHEAMTSLEELIPKNRLKEIQFVDQTVADDSVRGIVIANLATRRP